MGQRQPTLHENTLGGAANFEKKVTTEMKGLIDQMDGYAKGMAGKFDNLKELVQPILHENLHTMVAPSLEKRLLEIDAKLDHLKAHEQQTAFYLMNLDAARPKEGQTIAQAFTRLESEIIVLRKQFDIKFTAAGPTTTTSCPSATAIPAASATRVAGTRGPC